MCTFTFTFLSVTQASLSAQRGPQDPCRVLPTTALSGAVLVGRRLQGVLRVLCVIVSASLLPADVARRPRRRAASFPSQVQDLGRRQETPPGCATHHVHTPPQSSDVISSTVIVVEVIAID